MPTIRAILDKDHIKAAAAAAEARGHTSRDPLIYADDRELGLSIRVQASTARWVLKYRGKTRVIGSLTEVRTVSDARALARETREVMRDGIGDEAKKYVRQRRTGKTPDQAIATVVRQAAVQEGKWVWEDLARRYPDDYLAKPRVNTRGVHRAPSPKSVVEARRYLNHPVALEQLGGRLLMDLRRSDFEAVRDELYEDGHRITASRQFVAYAKAAMTWAKANFAGKSGLEDSLRWWHDVAKRQETIPSAKSRFPEVDEIARILRVAEANPVMPGRDIRRATSEVVLCSLWWIALTGQRASAALAVRKDHVLPWLDGPEGWRVVGFPAENMKGKRFFYLPIPPRVGMLLDRVALSADPSSSFVFPAQRKAAGKIDECLHRSTPRLLLQRLRGRPSDLSIVSDDEEEKPSKPGPDLLSGISHFAPHDLRRSLATACGNLSIRGDAISAVLDHADGTHEGPRHSKAPSVAEITRMAYDYSQRLPLKAIAMEAWADLLFAACDDEWSRRGAVVRPVTIPRRPGEAYPERPTFRHWEPWYRTMERWEAGRPRTTQAPLRLGQARRAMEDSEPEDA